MVPPSLPPTPTPALPPPAQYPLSTGRRSHIRTTGALAAVAMGAQNAWTTRSSIKASTVIIGANLQKVQFVQLRGR
eukprot:scaffold10457_cov106-Isochrysis_galbana.AAC.2